MNYVIYKYSLNFTERTRIDLEIKGFKRALAIQDQRNVPCLWARVDIDDPVVTILGIQMIGTGHEVGSALLGYDHITTIQQAGGAFVWHFFIREIAKVG